MSPHLPTLLPQLLYLMAFYLCQVNLNFYSLGAIYTYLQYKLNIMILDYEPGDKVTNPDKKEWGIGQVQSIINDKVTVNFENVGKKVINARNIELQKLGK